MEAYQIASCVCYAALLFTVFYGCVVVSRHVLW